MEPASLVASCLCTPEPRAVRHRANVIVVVTHITRCSLCPIMDLPLPLQLELERLKCHNAQLRLDAFVSRAQLRIARLLPGSSHCTPATPRSARVVRATLSPRAVTVAGAVPRRTCSPPLRPRVLRMGPALAAAAAAAATPNTDSPDASATPEDRKSVV